MCILIIIGIFNIAGLLHYLDAIELYDMSPLETIEHNMRRLNTIGRIIYLIFYIVSAPAFCTVDTILLLKQFFNIIWRIKNGKRNGK